MAINATHITSGGSDSSVVTSVSTASISPSANKLILVFVHQHNTAGGTPTTPTLSGASMTWTQVLTRVGVNDTGHRMTVFRAMTTTPGTGALTFNFGGQTQNEVFWIVDEFNGVVKSGTNGSDAIVQSSGIDELSSSAVITLSAFTQISNPTYTAGKSGGGTLVLDSDFIELGDYISGHAVMSGWSRYNQTTTTWSGDPVLQGVSIELNAEPDGGSFIFNMI